jgi:hypothetical protein
VEDVPEGACKKVNMVLNVVVEVACEKCALRSVECLDAKTDAKKYKS